MKIIETQGKSGTRVYSSIDEDRGVPYCSVFVNQDGDYWFTVYGALSFKRSDHDRILEKCSPIGKDITAKLYKEGLK